MSEKEAGVRVKLTGEEEVVAGASKVSSAWGEVGTKAAGAFKTMGREVASAVQGVLSDLGHVVSAAGAINFAASVQSVDRLEESVARMGVASGRSIQSVQQSVNTLSQEINEMPEATAAWVNSVGALTYSYERAAGSAKGLSEYAAQTGQSMGEVAPLAVLLDQVGAGGERSAAALEKMTAQARMLGRSGVREVGDELAHLSGQISQLSNTDPSKITALVAGFGGSKGFTPQQRERALSGVLGRIEGNAEGFERHFGMKRGSFTDEYGHMKDPTQIMKMLQDYGKQSAGAKFRLEQTFGREGTAALAHTDFAAIANAAKAPGDASGAHALERLKDSPAGVRRAQEIAKNIAMQDALGANSMFGGVRRMIGDASAEHPFLTTAGMMVGSKLLGVGAGALKTSIFGGGGAAAATGGAAAGEVGVGGSLLTGLGLAGAGVAALGVGTVAATGKTLMELGAASKVHQGFDDNAIGQGAAAGMRGRIAEANANAEANMSPGMKEALRLERDRKQREAAAAAPATAAGPGGDPRMQGLVDQMVKAGQSLQVAQDTAAKMIAMQNQMVQIEVVNATGGEIEARVRGHQ